MLPIRALAPMLLLSVLTAAPAVARDAFVLLSGGADPWSNNYSQYLQARAVAKEFIGTRPPDSVWIFFGAGNREGDAPVFGDVRRQTQDDDGVWVDSWFPGTLPLNRPARREAFLRALREEILPAVSGGGTLFLFVGDHGSETGGDDPESVIDLWGVERDSGNPRGWRTVSTEELAVGELRRELERGLGLGRVVFCMTQCHSGGFHELGTPNDVMESVGWYTGAPAIWNKAYFSAPAVAGFTATDPASLAAGCEPAPSPDGWAGYERFVPENLFGLDLFTLLPRAPRLGSFFEAHVAATLDDETIDRPYSTSEHYLLRWAELIESKLVDERKLKPEIRRTVARYVAAVDSGRPDTDGDGMLSERRDLFARFVARMAEQNPEARGLLVDGRRADLERAIDGGGEPAGYTAQSRRERRAREEAGRVWTKTLGPAWMDAVRRGGIPGLDGAAREFELHLLAAEAEGREFTIGDAAFDNLEEEMYWESGYADPATVDEARARAITRWSALRRDALLDWAAGLKSRALRSAAAKVFPEAAKRSRDAGPASFDDTPPGLARSTAAERALLYRRVLAAWAFLVEVKAADALKTVHRLTALERTPLPPPGARDQ